MSKWVKKILVFVLLGVVGISFGISGNVSALDKNTILAKAVYQGVYNCANSGAYSDSFNLALNANGFYANNKANEIELPYSFTRYNGNVANCRQIMNGGGIGDQGNTQGDVKLKGLLAIKTGTINWNSKEAVQYFAGTNYDGDGGIGYKLASGQRNDNGQLVGFTVEKLSDNMPFKMVAGLNANNGAGLKLVTLNSVDDLKLTPQEAFNLYSHYLINVFQVPFACEGDQNYNDFSGVKNEIKVGGKTCKYKVDGAKKLASNVYGVNDSGFFVGGGLSAQDVFNNVKEMAESGTVKTDELGAAMAGVDTSSSANGDSDNNDSEPTCEGSGAGASLGWILCPILNRLSSAAEGLYNYISPYLEINPQLFTGGNDGVRVAWETFRNIANILFIIVLLVVIFSQVTGLWLDNYGIKKILPKLIVAAVLINLSYLICLIFVDLSNIVGNGLLSLFNGLPSGDVASEVEGIGWNTAGNAISILSIGLITAFGAGALVAIISNPAILLSLLVSALGIVIALFFLFILLSARQVAIVILIVLSPLAFACMMLPNMKKLFSKWLKMSEGMLLLYPLCGLLIGAGNYVSRVMMANENVGFVTALVAMLVGVVPIFFIPTLLKNAFAAMDGIGAKISSFGNKMRGGATSRVRSSGAYKNLQTRGSEFGLRRRAGIDEDGNAVKMGRIRTMMRGGARGREKLMRQYAQAQSERNERNRLINGEGFASMSAGLEAKADSQRVSDIENLMAYGRMKVSDQPNENEIVNVNDTDSLEKFHQNALNAYRNAKTEEDKSAAMAKIKAAQNYLSKTDAGRGVVQSNLKNAVEAGNMDAARDAAAHLNSNFADLYKSKNRAASSMIKDLAAVGGSPEQIEEQTNAIKNKITSKGYDLSATDKYDQTSLAGADEAALKGMNELMQSLAEKGGLSNSNETERAAFERMLNTASKSLQMYNDGKLSIKPEALRYIQNIVDSGGLRIEHDSRRDVPLNDGGDAGFDGLGE